MTHLENFQKQRIEALDRYIEMQQNLIDEQAKAFDEMTYKYANEKARLNMLIRNIEVIDEIFEQPIKN